MIEIRQARAFRGPNIWSAVPVVHLLVNISEQSTTSTPNVSRIDEQLRERLPFIDLTDLRTENPANAAWAQRPDFGIALRLERIAIALQKLTGSNLEWGHTRALTDTSCFHVVYEYAQEDVGLFAGELAVSLLNDILGSTPGTFDLDAKVERTLLPLCARLGYGPSTSSIVRAAERRGIPAIRLDSQRSLVQFGHGRAQRRIWATIPSSTSYVGVEIAGNKALTNRLLRDSGVPGPAGDSASSLEAARAIAGTIGFPVVVKPLDGNHGRGGTTNVRDDLALARAFDHAMAQSRQKLILIERFLPGRDYRVLVIGDRVVAVSERVPAHVVGDGASSVGTLIERTNADPRRGVGHERALTRIAVDDATRALVSNQRLSLDSVPVSGRIVWLKQTGNMSTGGTAIDRTDVIHPENAEIARRAARVVGLDVAGIDIVCPDIARSMRGAGGGVVEVNAAPGFRMHTHPTEGTPRDPGEAVMDLLFPGATEPRIPIVAIAGTKGKTGTARMMAAILQSAGFTVGLATSSGLSVDGVQVVAGDMTQPEAAQTVLKNPVVDCAVLECAWEGISRVGLGFDRCAVGIVTNVLGDNLDARAIGSIEQLAEVKAVVPHAVFHDGCSVLSADDLWTAGMARHARGEVIFFSLDEHSRVVLDHLRDRGRAVVMEKRVTGDVIALHGDGYQRVIVSAADLGIARSSADRHRIANALAAVAAAIGMGIEPDCISSALRDVFRSDVSPETIDARAVVDEPASSPVPILNDIAAL